jgi:type IV secretion system protein VirB6
MVGFCPTPTDDLGVVRGLLGSVDCNIRVMSEAGYQAATGPNSQLALVLTSLLTIYVAIYGLRLLLGLAPLRVGDTTVTALKIGLILALATSWTTYQQVVFNTLFHGPEQLAASMMGAMQPQESLLRGNPFDGLQVAYDQLQAAALFFQRVSPPAASPFTGGVAFAAFSLNSASYLMIFATLGVVLTAKIVLGLLLALGPIFIALLLFDSTRGVFEGWLRASLAFAFAPLFAILSLAIQLTLIEPQILALADMRTTGNVDLAAATSAFILTVISAGVSAAGVIGIFIIAMGFKLPWKTASASNSRSSGAGSVASVSVPAFVAAPSRGASQLAQPRVSAITAAAASMDRRDLRLVESEGPRRLSVGAQAANGTAAADAARRDPIGQSYRRSAQPRRAASSARRDR